MTEITLLDGIRRIFDYRGEECPEICLTEGEYYSSVLVDGVNVPVFSYRTAQKLEGMKLGELLGRPCALTSTSVGHDTLRQILFRELDAAEFLLESRVEHITAYVCDSSANVIAGMENGSKAHMQLHSSPYGERQFHHELFTDSGTVSDRAVDSVIAQHALNVYTQDGHESYTDSDILLYGLSECQQELAYGIYDAFHLDRDELVSRAERLSGAVKAALESGRTCYSGEDF